MMLRVQNWLRVLAIMAIVPISACGQDDDFDRMLNRLLRGDVEFAHPPRQGEDLSGVVLLDAREEREYNVSHLPDAIWIGYDDFELARVTDIDRDAPIVVYCSVGYRSERIARRLIQAGFSDVRNLYGGIFNWVNTGNEVSNRFGATDSVHTYNRKWSKWLNEGVKVYE
jgi:rhodanese-related sulfurtransferase